METPKSALVFGASGITGWAIANSALTYPTKETFARVIALTNRPLSREDSKFPEDSRLVLQSGVDLSGDHDSIVRALRLVDGISNVTHVYFTAYVHRGWGADGSGEQVEANVELLMKSLKAVELLCPSLQFITWPSGGKWYGFEHAAELHPKAPFKETNARVPSPHGNHIFYYNQYDAISEYAQGKRWSFADIRPDAIIGFVPNNNPMNLAQPIALYLSLWASLNPGKAAPFPGTATSYKELHTDISQDLLAKMHIYVSLNPDKTAGGSFNVADATAGNSWETVWPDICRYFGVEAAGPHELAGEAWVVSVQEKWERWEEEKGLKKNMMRDTNWKFLTVVAGEYSEFDRSLDTSLARKIGFMETMDHVESYRRAFDRMREANLIPAK